MILAQLGRAAVEKIDSIYNPHEAVILMLIFKYIHLIASSLRIASKKLVSINASLFLSVW